ncbi:late competence development ComFB family protein [[Clostridium] colinum]|uniref:late competence development ComFB family protein n=1 Tax=[Clostridium] colinum TaxID=36835 RepID=UPI0020244868|nr:late competence development ComFB family protein [[Clostridium] colinum]
MKTQMEVKNYMEELVCNQLEEVMRKNNCSCFCDRCKADIMAISLNNLPTKYVATEKGICYAKLSSYENQCLIDIITAITNAIKIVEKHPRHKDNE